MILYFFALLYRNSYRLIVAGGGTGAVTLFYGEQLNHTNAEIMYLDFSSASMQISKKRSLGIRFDSKHCAVPGKASTF